MPPSLGRAQLTGADRSPQGASGPRSRLHREARELCHWAMDVAWLGAKAVLVVAILWLGLVMAFGMHP